MSASAASGDRKRTRKTFVYRATFQGDGEFASLADACGVIYPSSRSLDARDELWRSGGGSGLWRRRRDRRRLSRSCRPAASGAAEPFVDAATGLDGVRETPIEDRIERAAERLARFVALRETPAQEKRVALIYYNYPPGKENIGASYLNVLPKSLRAILERLKTEGYDLAGAPQSDEELFTLIRERGGNINGWNSGTLEERSARASSTARSPCCR
ncbi:MAG TPA: cobaltochelatase subunit CobN [Methylosinus sp.]|uniref:cobaltochelatase subunit CobN n=1 Tax=Methylosinus sp. TaxID=427 RepID=UPI002F93F97D